MGWFRTDKSTKYAQAMMKVAVNMLEVAVEGGRRDHAPLVLKFERPDTKLRYMAFCLGTTYYFAVNEHTLQVLDQALRKCWAQVGRWALTTDGAALFSGPVERSEAIQQAEGELLRTIEGWKDYSNYLVSRQNAGQATERDDRSARLVCAMLRRVESTAPIAEDDVRRLLPLARWIEETTGVLESSVEQLAR